MFEARPANFWHRLPFDLIAGRLFDADLNLRARCSQLSPSAPATITRPSQGAQERLVPARKGSIPEAPEGEHSSQFGTLLDATPVALPDDPAGFAEEGARDALDRDALDGVLALPPDAAPVGAVPEVDPATVVPVAVDDVD